MTTAEMNRKAWWEWYFSAHWQNNQGQSQTRGFMTTLLTHLPASELRYLSAEGRSILDWGCAMGDGVELLGTTFPYAHVSGLDFSEQALQVARQAYPRHRFIHTPDGAIPTAFDVIVTSNCLEHFADPVALARTHLRSCRDVYIVLVPYQEPYPLLDQHVLSFTEETFPERLDGFTRLVSQPVQVSPLYWRGTQLLLIYGSESYCARRQQAIDVAEVQAAEALRVSVLREEYLLTAQRTVEVMQRLGEQRQRLAEQDATIERLEQRLAQAERDLQVFWTSKAGRLTRAWWQARAEGPKGYARLGARLSLRVAHYVGTAAYQRTIPRIMPRALSERRQQREALPKQPGPNSRAYRAAVRSASRSLDAIVAAHPEARGVVVIPPTCPWHMPLFQRPQQMALAFARLGYLVIYWEETGVVAAQKQFEQVAERVYVALVPPEALRRLHRPIAVTYHYNYDWVRKLNEPQVVYEYIDHWDLFSNYDQKMLEANHQHAMRTAVVAVGTADDLVATLRPERPDALLAPNGVEYEVFAAANSAAIPDDLRAIVSEGKPIIGYYGGMAEWLDWALINDLSHRMPDVNFVFIGPTYAPHLDEKVAQLGTLPNVHVLGARPYRSLPGYLAAFSVATIPFTVNDVIQAVSPIKLFEYMAGGKPVVTSDMAECRKYPEVRIATTPEQWVEQLRAAIRVGRDPAFVEQLRARARENTWDARAQAILAAIERKRRNVRLAAQSESGVDFARTYA